MNFREVIQHFRHDWREAFQPMIALMWAVCLMVHAFADKHPWNWICIGASVYALFNSLIPFQRMTTVVYQRKADLYMAECVRLRVQLNSLYGKHE